MKNATLRQLRIFEIVARHLSFSRAAEELYLTQPAVSIQVKQLEEHAGLPLFEQLGKKIYLTPAGTEMLHYAHSIIAQFREMDEAMSRLQGIGGGQLNIAVISAGDYFLPRLLAEFARHHDGVKFNLAVHNREEVLHQLSNNLTDLAIMVRPPQNLDTCQESFAPHPYVIVAPPGHPLVGKKRVPLATIAKEPFIVRERGSDTWNSMEDGLAGRIAGLNIIMEIRSTETIKQAVIAGMGISFLSAHTISMELQAGNLAILDVEDFPVMLDWYVVHHKNKRLPLAAQAFKEFLIDEGAQQIAHITHIDIDPLHNRLATQAGAER